MDLHKDKTLGYWYFIDQKHPLSNKSRKVYYHRHIMSIHLGRWLDTNEVVHHIDNDKDNNKISNLKLTTFSDHAKLHNLNDPWGRKKKKVVVLKHCTWCSTEFKSSFNKQMYCSYRCARLAARKFSIRLKDLRKLVWKYPTTFIAKIYGVSDSAIAKRCKLFGIRKPPRGYWSRHVPVC